MLICYIESNQMNWRNQSVSEVINNLKVVSCEN